MSNWHPLTRQKVVDVIADGHLFVHKAYLRDFKIMSIICLSSCMTLSRWAVFKTPLLFHYTGRLIGIPLLDNYNPSILGSISNSSSALPGVLNTVFQRILRWLIPKSQVFPSDFCQAAPCAPAALDKAVAQQGQKRHHKGWASQWCSKDLKG